MSSIAPPRKPFAPLAGSARTSYVGGGAARRFTVEEYHRLLDAGVLTEADLSCYVASLERNGFFGPDSWYMNHARNIAYARKAPDNGRLSMPVLFLHGAYDYTCETIDSRLAEPMRAHCADLTEVVVESGHWMAQENPVAVNAALARFLVAKLPAVWGNGSGPSSQTIP